MSTDSPLPSRQSLSAGSSRITRRRFVERSALIASGVATGLYTSSQAAPRPRFVAPNAKLNLGIIGAGGRGLENLQSFRTENIVALCDVDDVRAQRTFAEFPQARRYRDFRQMLTAEPTLDAVVVSTPDHLHATAAITAMKLGKHVYCEKPLAHSIQEVRRMSQVARETGVVTQMGIQGHAMEGTRRAVEIIRSGGLGEVREVHVWTDRPAGWWPQGVEAPIERLPVPSSLDWDLWLGPAAWQPYHPIYLPFKWRGFYAFGTGSIGDMGVHNLDPAFWGLELGLPRSAVLRAAGTATSASPAAWNVIEMDFPARGKRPPVKLWFYDGNQLPPEDLFMGEPIPSNGSLIVGSRGTLFTRTWHGGATDQDMFLLLPRKTFAQFTAPPLSLPRAADHHQEWIQACKGGPRTQAPFEYAAVLTEALLVGLLAQRTGQPIQWDAARMKAKGLPQADRYIRPDFRRGWEL